MFDLDDLSYVKRTCFHDSIIVELRVVVMMQVVMMVVTMAVAVAVAGGKWILIRISLPFDVVGRRQVYMIAIKNK